jgi:hypothetical protein
MVLLIDGKISVRQSIRSKVSKVLPRICSMNSSSSQNGYILYLSLILLFIFSIYTGVMLMSRHLQIMENRHHLRKLQATVLSYSGLNCAQGYAAGYDGGDMAWETQELKRTVENAGTIILSAYHDAGWLKVKSMGCSMNDTTVLTGILGQAPPSISLNALSIGRSSNDVVVADLSSVKGNIGTSGGKVITRNNGIFNGKVVQFKAIDYSGEIIEKECNYTGNR